MKLLFIYLTFCESISAMSHQVDLRIVVVEGCKFFGRETYVGCTEEIIEMSSTGCTRNRDYPWFARQHPYEGELCGSDTLALCMTFYEMHERHVVL